MKVSYHHNWFDRTPQRNPRVRFGEPVHVYNNYYVYNTDTGVACQNNGGCLVEGNYFEDVAGWAGRSPDEPAGPADRRMSRRRAGDAPARRLRLDPADRRRAAPPVDEGSFP